MSAPFQRIVVGLDLAPADCSPTSGSLAAYRTALWLAGGGGAQVVLLHSLAQQEYFDPLTNELVALCGSVSPEGRARLSTLLEELRARGATPSTVDSREPAPVALAREVAQRNADLVLLGKHDGREVDASRIGPIALRVLREATTAVWAVTPGRPIEPRTIVAATDLTQTSSEAVACADRIAALAGAELHVVHVQPPALHTRPGSTSEREQRTREAMTASLPAERRAAAKLHLRVNSPAQGVLELCEELEPDLVVFGALAHRRDKPGVIGSTAERLIGRLETSLLVLRPT
ncbi:MAG: universal stress protein [Planctomycetes bacterium]|nr:universal stress protein [Planctomycetota bacterium]